RRGFTEPSAFARRIKGMTADANVPPIDRPLPDDPRLLQEMVRELLATLRAAQRRAEQLEQRLDRLRVTRCLTTFQRKVSGARTSVLDNSITVGVRFPPRR